jgi:Spy/CpxP family protein refolding chaperone
LDLTPAQREPINRILKEGQERTKKIMDTVEPQRREEFSRTIEAFRAVLTPAQQQQLNALLKQQQRRAREQRKAAAPPPRPPPGAAPAP